MLMLVLLDCHAAADSKSSAAMPVSSAVPRLKLLWNYSHPGEVLGTVALSPDEGSVYSLHGVDARFSNASVVALDSSTGEVGRYFRRASPVHPRDYHI